MPGVQDLIFSISTFFDKKNRVVKKINDYPVSSANVKVDEETQAFSNLGNN